jgi:autotransporter-associated beta strand protein
MKSKFNPFLFRALATGAALFAIAPLHAVEIDTTGTTVTLSPQNKYIGNGTLEVSGGGNVWLGGGGGDPETEFAMTGGLIDIVSATTLKNGGWQKGVWTDNLASLQVNGTLDVNDGNDIFADALTGSGTVIIPSGITWFILNKSITVGVNGGGGTFTGTISDSDDDTLSLIKTGGGTQILTGANTYRGATTINGGTLKLQGAAFSTTARAYSIASGAVLNLDGGTGVAWGNTTISGTGTLRISGGWQGSGDDGRDLTLALGSGAVIEIQPGATLYNGGWQNMTWTDNKASLQVDGTLEMTNGNWINADALTGSGAVTMDVSWATWANSLTVGVNGGGGTFTGTISDSGDDTLRLTKTGGGTQILTGTNSYRGNTTVNGGTLSLGNGTTNTALADTADVTVDSGCTLNLNYTGTDTINKLFLGGVQVASGTWGSLASGATHTSALITGSGLLNVLSDPPITDPFANWMTTNYPGILTPDNEPGADPDNDGIANLMEYVLQGGDPSVSTTGTLPTLDASGANFVFTYYRRAAATGTTQTFEYSTTLGAGSWTPVAIPGGAGVVVTPDTPGAGIDKVEITVAKGAETKLFGRLQVVK